MDKIPNLGHLITNDQPRDAIHIAVAPVIAGEDLRPGQRIGFADEGDSFTVVSTSRKVIGIVDPFLFEKAVYKGKRFYMLLLPNTITNLRHDWTHPAFEEEDRLSQLEPTLYRLKGAVEEEKWVTEFANSIGSTYGELMQAAEDYIVTGNYLVRGSTFEGASIPDEFWNKYEIIKRKKVDETDRGTFLSCSC